MQTEKHPARIVSEFAGDDEMARIVVSFVRVLPSRIQALCEAYSGERWDEVRRLSHQLKGAAGGYGFRSLGELAAQVEATAGGPDCRDRLLELVALSDRVAEE